MIDYSKLAMPKPPKRRKPEVKKDGRLVLSPAKWQKQKREMWYEINASGVYWPICHLCHGVIASFDEFEPDHIITKGHGGGKRDDRRENLAPSHSWCNRERSSQSVEQFKLGKRLTGKANQ